MYFIESVIVQHPPLEKGGEGGFYNFNVFCYKKEQGWIKDIERYILNIEVFKNLKGNFTKKSLLTPFSTGEGSVQSCG